MIDIPIALHIPDGFLSGGVAAVCAVLAIAAVAYGLRVANVELDEARVPLLGVLAAFIFAAQMLNFPIAGGTSGHFLGATLAAVLLVPWLACLVLAVVLVVQALSFADGGITALGANVLNMGVLGRCWPLLWWRHQGSSAHARRPSSAPSRGVLAGGDGRGGSHERRARRVGHGAAWHVAARDAGPALADRYRRGGDNGCGGERGARRAARPGRAGTEGAHGNRRARGPARGRDGLT